MQIRIKHFFQLRIRIQFWIQGFATGPPRVKDPSKLMRMLAWKLASGGRGEMERNKMKKPLAESWRRYSMIYKGFWRMLGEANLL
jgi:hypothetical protein